MTPKRPDPAPSAASQFQKRAGSRTEAVLTRIGAVPNAIANPASRDRDGSESYLRGAADVREIPFSTAQAASWVRDANPSFPSALATYPSTVRSPIPSS